MLRDYSHILQKANAVSDLCHSYIFLTATAWNDRGELNEEEAGQLDSIWHRMNAEERQMTESFTEEMNRLAEGVSSNG